MRPTQPLCGKLSMMRMLILKVLGGVISFSLSLSNSLF